MQPSLGYVPALDALRGLAIIMVVAFHAWAVPAAGYLGVDLFFVLSGFLITTLLLEEHAQSGSLSLSAFYRRRFVRLAPAFYVFAATIAILGLWAGSAKLLESVGWASIYLADWHSGADPDVPRIVTHLWSLAIEEQFYFIWPLLLALVLRRHSINSVRIVLGVGLAVILAGRSLSDASPAALEYWPQFRAEGLLWGCLLATFYMTHRSHVARLVRPAVAYACLAALLTLTFIPLTITSLYDTGLFTAVLVAMGVLVAAGSALGSQRPAALRPLVGMGRLSYSLYLWHLLFLTLLPTLVALPLSVGVAHLSLRFIERPFMRFKHRSASPDMRIPSKAAVADR